MVPSLLLVAPEPGATCLSHALRDECGVAVEVSPELRDSVTALRREQFSLVLLEENLAAAQTDATDALYANAGAAPVLEINFGICGVPRVVRSVRLALARRGRDEEKARSFAASHLHNELNASLTGLLLESQLALRQATPELRPTLQHIVELAASMRDQLRA